MSHYSWEEVSSFDSKNIHIEENNNKVESLPKHQYDLFQYHPGKKPDELRFWDVSLLMTGFISLKDLQVIYETHADCRMEINIYVHLTTYKYKLVIHGLSQHLIGAWAKIGLTGLTHLKNLKTKSRKIEKGKSVWWLVPFFRMKKLSK